MTNHCVVMILSSLLVINISLKRVSNKIRGLSLMLAQVFDAAANTELCVVRTSGRGHGKGLTVPIRETQNCEYETISSTQPGSG